MHRKSTYRADRPAGGALTPASIAEQGRRRLRFFRPGIGQWEAKALFTRPAPSLVPSIKAAPSLEVQTCKWLPQMKPWIVILCWSWINPSLKEKYLAICFRSTSASVENCATALNTYLPQQFCSYTSTQEKQEHMFMDRPLGERTQQLHPNRNSWCKCPSTGKRLNETRYVHAWTAHNKTARAPTCETQVNLSVIISSEMRQHTAWHCLPKGPGRQKQHTVRNKRSGVSGDERQEVTERTTKDGGGGKERAGGGNPGTWRRHVLHLSEPGQEPLVYTTHCQLTLPPVNHRHRVSPDSFSSDWLNSALLRLSINSFLKQPGRM